MGCDIHAYIDYDEKYQNEEPYTTNFAKLHISRNYWLFTILSGTRGDQVQEQTPVSCCKGLPKSISWQVQEDAYMCITEYQSDEPNTCTREQAEKWGSKYIDENKMRIQNPDWHSHSWLTLEEVKEVIRKFSLLKFTELSEDSTTGKTITIVKDEQIPVEISAIKATMESIENNGNPCRLIFWYDN